MRLFQQRGSGETVQSWKKVHLSSMPEALGSTPRRNKLGQVLQGCSLSSGEVEVGGSEIQSHAGLSEFQASLHSTVGPCLKVINKYKPPPPPPPKQIGRKKTAIACYTVLITEF